MAFRIQSDKKETENKTIRFPLELINRIEQATTEHEVTFFGFVIQACTYALDNIVAEKKRTEKYNKINIEVLIV